LNKTTKTPPKKEPDKNAELLADLSMEPTEPTKPEGLGLVGSELWAATVRAYDLRADENTLLAELCHLADDVDRLRRELEGQPLTVVGSRGQPTINPLRLELHRTTTRLESLAKTLALPDLADTANRNRTLAGRALARQRWG
jgi:hypothetical protein